MVITVESVEHVTIKPYMILKNIFNRAPLLSYLAKICKNFNRKPLLTNNEICTKSQITLNLDLDESMKKILINANPHADWPFAWRTHADRWSGIWRNYSSLSIIFRIISFCTYAMEIYRI